MHKYPVPGFDGSHSVQQIFGGEAFEHEADGLFVANVGR